MNTRTLKLTAVVLLAGHASYVSADFTANPEMLGTSPTSTDAFTLDCAGNANNVRARVTDLNNENPDNTAAQLYVMVMDPFTGTSKGVKDTSEGNASNWSGWSLRVYGGLGPYDVTFEKVNASGAAAGGSEYYRGEAECYDPGNSALAGENLH